MRRGGPDQTEYCISAIPLGGYVRLLDEREQNVAAHELHRTFNRQPVRNRIAILFAGPALNFLFAILAYWCMFIIGVPGVTPIVGEVRPASIAADAGLKEQDRIVAVAGQPVGTWEGATLELIDAMLSDARVALEVQGTNGMNRLAVLDLGDKVASLTEPGKLFVGIGFDRWVPDFPPRLSEISPGGAAERAGIIAGDRVVAADGQQMRTWTDWVNFIQVRPGETTTVTVERNGKLLEVDLTIGEMVQDDGSLVGFIGTAPFVPPDLFEGYFAEQSYGVWQAVPAAVERTWSMSALTVRMVSRMVTGDVSVKNISGPINIAQYAGYSALGGLASFLSFLAIVSLSLGILNLLPIPVLDGGQIVYQLLEAIKGQPLSERAQLMGQQIGIVFLMLMMSFAFYNDLNQFFS
jgi:regulator of sigma E protease